MKAQLPNGDVVDVLVTPNGELATDQSPKPVTAEPSNFNALRVDPQGRVLLA